jgi:hypothetical protein
MKKIILFILFSTVSLHSHSQNLSASQLTQLRNNLAICSGNYVLIISSIKSQILTFGSDSNNEKTINVSGALNTIYSEIGKSIKGQNYDRIAEDFYNSKIENFRNQKATLGVTQAKENIINDMITKFESCTELLQDPRNAKYAASVIGTAKANLLTDYINQNMIK